MAPMPTSEPASHVNSTEEGEDFRICDDLVQARAADKNQTPLLCFPKSERGVTDYEKFTGKDLDRFIDEAAKYYMRCGLKPTQRGNPPIIALLGPTDLAYIITCFALARLGYTSLCLSPRLAPNARAKLIKETGAEKLIPGLTKKMALLAAQIQELKQIELVKMVEREHFDRQASNGQRFHRENIDKEAEKDWTFLILHSSGTTGLPKAIYLPHKRLMMKTPPPKGQVDFSTFPFFHGYGNWTVVHNMMDRKATFLFNPNLPVTADYCIDVLEHVRPDVLHVVPYTLELLALSERGVNAMKRCQRVVFSGSGCPDDLGNDLVAKGVNVETLWGATEIGSLGTSFGRPPGDDTWDYIRIPPPVVKYIWMKPLGDGTYECIYLNGLPALVASNSDDPPKSFHSKDIFLKHPKIDAWKHIGRLDDRLTLINGEKVLPLPMEGTIRQHPHVRESVVFGAGKSIPGVLAFRNDGSKYMTDDEFINAIWPAVEKANNHAESFSQISKETIVPLSAEVDYPKTDKESIKRAQIYRVFTKEIDAMYEKLEYNRTGTLRLDIPSIGQWLLKTFKESLAVRLLDMNDDFFAAGVNSLQAIQMRGLILKDLDLGGNNRKLGQNVVFDSGDVARLAKHLYAFRFDKVVPEDDDDEIEAMSAMIKKYSNFKMHVPGSAPVPEGHVVVLTGATGSLGVHILVQLLNRSDVRYVYCLARGENPQERVLQALRQRNLRIPDTSPLMVLRSDLSRTDLGLPPETYEELKRCTTTIIHTAWAVNFNLGTSSFEHQHIKGVHNLTQFSLSVSTPTSARLYFCSSIAVALATPSPATILEAPMTNLKAALSQGYARSKLVGEHVVRNAAVHSGASTRILRIGQIVGDGKLGLWNDTEAIPLIIRSALTLQALPALDENESWLPVDTLATAIIELTGISAGYPPAPDSDTELVYNLENRNTFPWTNSLLPELQRSGLSFEIVPVTEWLKRLRDFERNGGDPERNPALKLLDHFDRMYAGAEKTEREVRFEIKMAEKHSQSLRESPNLIEDGYIRKFVKSWLEKWEGEGSNDVASSG